MAAVLLAAASFPLMPVGMAGAGDAASDGGALRGSGLSVAGAWTWERIPGQVAPPAVRASPHSLAYAFTITDPGDPDAAESREFHFSLDLGSDLHLVCERSGAQGTLLADQAGAGALVARGVPVSRGTCTLDHPWDQQAWPRAVLVAYEGVFAEDSCEPATLPSALPYLSGFQVPPVTCHAPLAGNLQTWRGAGRFFGDQRVDGAPEPDPDAMTRSAAPWQGDWRWREAVVHGQLPLVQDDATLRFAHTPAQASAEGGMAYHAVAHLASAPFRVDCLRDPTDAAAAGAGVGFLLSPETDAVVSSGPCAFEPGIGAVLTSSFPLPADACGLPTMPTGCALLGVHGKLVGEGVFFR